MLPGRELGPRVRDASPAPQCAGNTAILTLLAIYILRTITCIMNGRLARFGRSGVRDQRPFPLAAPNANEPCCWKFDPEAEVYV